MTKTDRILSYLPSTFQVQPGSSPLKTVVGTFGKELQDAENALAAVMRAHWVDHADRAAPAIDDLARLAAPSRASMTMPITRSASSKRRSA